MPHCADVRNWWIDCLSYFDFLGFCCTKKYDQSWAARGKNSWYTWDHCWSLLASYIAWLPGATSPHLWSLGGVATSVPEWFKLGTSSQESFASLPRSWQWTPSINTPVVGWRGFAHRGETWIISKQLPIDSPIWILAWSEQQYFCPMGCSRSNDTRKPSDWKKLPCANSILITSSSTSLRLVRWLC